ncbi:uncharacterized protein [Callorhinus ursinus]|uniref:uncharacterized protein n=1 Tax=Callorhinus ursinus TaxID=34884 RepID=UPI003CCFF5E2
MRQIPCTNYTIVPQPQNPYQNNARGLGPSVKVLNQTKKGAPVQERPLGPTTAFHRSVTRFSEADPRHPQSTGRRSRGSSTPRHPFPAPPRVPSPPSLGKCSGRRRPRRGPQRPAGPAPCVSTPPRGRTRSRGGATGSPNLPRSRLPTRATRAGTRSGAEASALAHPGPPLSGWPARKQPTPYPRLCACSPTPSRGPWGPRALLSRLRTVSRDSRSAPGTSKNPGPLARRGAGANHSALRVWAVPWRPPAPQRSGEGGRRTSGLGGWRRLLLRRGLRWPRGASSGTVQGNIRTA